MTFPLFIQWIGQVKSGHFYYCCFGTGHVVKRDPIVTEGCLQQIYWLGGWSMPSASRAGQLLVWECNTGTKKCSPAPWLSGQWSKDNLWKSLQRTVFQRWNLACRSSKKKAPRVGMSNKKIKMPNVGNWDTGISNAIQSEVYGWEIPKRGGEALPTCLCTCWIKCHILFAVYFGWLKNSLKSSNISQEKILGFFLGVSEGGGVLFNLTFLVFKLENFQHPGVKLKSLSLGSLGAYQKSMAWRMEKVSKMWDWQEILAHFCLIFTFLACSGSFSANGKCFSAKPLSDKSAHKYTLNWHVTFEIKF